MKKLLTLIGLAILNIIIIGLIFCSFQPFIIELNGEEEMKIDYQEMYQEPGAQSIFGFGKVRIEGVVDNEKLGEYIVNYYFANACKQRKVIVCDKKKPEVTLNGPTSMTIALGGTYKEYGANAYDEIDGDLTSAIEIVNEVDVNTVGEYYVLYYSTDSSGNKARARRLVSVVNDGPLVQSISEFSLDGCFQGTILKETNEDTSEKMKNLLFAGDSMIDNLALFGYIKMSQTWARSSLGPENIYTREMHIPRSTTKLDYFFNALEKEQPEYIALLMGTVDMVTCSTEYFVECYREFLNKFKVAAPETKLIIISILPVTQGASEAANKNDKINKANYYLAQMAQEYGYYFMNVAEVFKDKNGYGNSSLFMDDYVHPTANYGCQLMIKYIKTHLSY